MPRAASYLLRRHETYYFRMAIPQILRSRIHKSEIVKSLQTTQYGVAQRQARIMTNYLESMFAKIAPMSHLNRAQIEALILAKFEEIRKSTVDNFILPDDTDHREMVAELSYDYHQALRENILTPPTSHFPPPSKTSNIPRKANISPYSVANLFTNNGYEVPPVESEAYRYAEQGMKDMAEEIARLLLAKAEFLPLADRSPQGRFAHHTTPPTATSPDIQRKLLAELIKEWLDSKVSGNEIKPKYRPQVSSILNNFLVFMQKHFSTKNVYLDSITFKSLTEYRNNLIQKENIPTKASKGHAHISPRTARKYMAPLNQLFLHAQRNNYIQTNPYSPTALAIKVKKRETKKYDDFKPEELAKLFGSKEFNAPGTIQKSYDWWLPILAAYTGCRMAELVMLNPNDLEFSEETYYLNIIETEERSLKNDFSTRKVPIHPQLVSLGFLDFAAKRRGKGFLFEEVSTTKNPPAAYSRRFSRLLTKLKLKRDLLVFHSFRHTFITALRKAKVMKEHRIAITGHSAGDVHDNYGGSYPIKLLHEEISKLHYDLDWEALIPKAKIKTDVM